VSLAHKGLRMDPDLATGGWCPLRDSLLPMYATNRDCQAFPQLRIDPRTGPHFCAGVAENVRLMCVRHVTVIFRERGCYCGPIMGPVRMEPDLDRPAQGLRRMFLYCPCLARCSEDVATSWWMPRKGKPKRLAWVSCFTRTLRRRGNAGSSYPALCLRSLPQFNFFRRTS
jgi:hypothetical protein